MGVIRLALPASASLGPAGEWMWFMLRTLLRSLQLVLALAVAGLYGTDLNRARKENVPGDSKWVSP